MDYELIPIEPEVAGKVHILKGTVVDPDGHIVKTVGDTEEWVIKADVDIDGFGIIEDILVVYHCQYSEKAGVEAFAESEEEEDDNPLIIGGSPFVKDDRVIVLNYGDAIDLEVDKLKVVGYEDGLPRPCIFQFRITRDDGEIADETIFGCDCSLVVYQKDIDAYQGRKSIATLWCYDPDSDDEEFLECWTHTGNVWFLDWVGHGIKCSYNTDTKIWTVPFYEGIPRKQNKDFWVEFHNRGKTIIPDEEYFKEVKSWYAVPEGTKIEDGYSTAEPEYIYKEADRWQDKDLIVSKFYELRVPYVKVTLTDNKVMPTITREDLAANGCKDGHVSQPYKSTINKSFTETLTVDSSVDYYVRFKSRYHRGAGDPYGCPNVVFSGARFISEKLWDCPYMDVPPSCVYAPDNCVCEKLQASFHYYCKGIMVSWVHVTDSNGGESSDIEAAPVDSTKNVSCVPYSIQSESHTLTCNYIGPDPYSFVRACVKPGPPPYASENIFPLNFEFFCCPGGVWFSGVNYD